MSYDKMKGKTFKPAYPYGPKPIPSAQFSYDHNNCRDWFDRWLERGGTISRDCVYVKIANDFPDLRGIDEQERWRKINGALQTKRSSIRIVGLSMDILHARRKVIELR